MIDAQQLISTSANGFFRQIICSYGIDLSACIKNKAVNDSVQATPSQEAEITARTSRQSVSEEETPFDSLAEPHTFAVALSLTDVLSISGGVTSGEDEHSFSLVTKGPCIWTIVANSEEEKCKWLSDIRTLWGQMQQQSNVYAEASANDHPAQKWEQIYQEADSINFLDLQRHSEEEMKKSVTKPE